MTNIIDFQKYKDDCQEPESWGYFKNLNGDLGVRSYVCELGMSEEKNDRNSIMLDLDGHVVKVDRKALAEALWGFAYWLDSDKEWRDEGPYVCLNKD